MALKPEIKVAWLDALRSGEYKQARGVLCEADTGKMCCLGVLADVALDTDWVLSEEGSETKYKENGVPEDVYGIRTKVRNSWNGEEYWDIATETLPDSVREKLGLSEGDLDTLVQLNDGDNGFPGWGLRKIRPRSFKQIAKWIEKNL